MPDRFILFTNGWCFNSLGNSVISKAFRNKSGTVIFFFFSLEKSVDPTYDIIKVSVKSRMLIAVGSKFELLMILIASNIDVLIISETMSLFQFHSSCWGFLFTEVEKHMDRSSRLQMFFKIGEFWIFFHEHSRFTTQQGNEEDISLTSLYHFHPLPQPAQRRRRNVLFLVS